MDELASAAFTYSEQGRTAARPLPSAYQHVQRTTVIGSGRQQFERATDALFTWRMHRLAGMTVTASSPRADPGVVATLRIGWRPLTVTAPVRVVYAVQDPKVKGFAYGTLPGHPESGEEAFLVRLTGLGDVLFEIVAFSRPATVLARTGGPLTRSVQRLITDRYVRALRHLAAD